MSEEERIDFTKITYNILTPSDNVEKFCCGNKDIDDFIHKEAWKFQNESLGVSYLFYYLEELIGFVTLSMADLRKEKIIPEDKLSLERENYPALHISQLARCEGDKFQGVGTALCYFSLTQAIELSERVGCRFLVLNAERKVIGFYEQCGFKLLQNQEKRRQPMMFLSIPLSLRSSVKEIKKRIPLKFYTDK